MNEQDVRRLLVKVRRAIKETDGEVNAKELYRRLAPYNNGLSREWLAFALGWLAKDQSINLEIRDGEIYVSERQYDFVFG